MGPGLNNGRDSLHLLQAGITARIAGAAILLPFFLCLRNSAETIGRSRVNPWGPTMAPVLSANYTARRNVKLYSGLGLKLYAYTCSDRRRALTGFRVYEIYVIFGNILITWEILGTCPLGNLIRVSGMPRNVSLIPLRRAFSGMP